MFLLGSLAYLTAATHGLVEECEEIKATFNLDPEKVTAFFLVLDNSVSFGKPLRTKSHHEASLTL